MIVESYEDIIILSGALRSNFWETIHTAIALTLKRHPTGVIIDCAGITECTPEGAETFRDALEYIEEHDARIIMARVPDHVLEVIRATPGVRSQVPIVATVEEARRSLDLLAQPEGKKRKAATDPSSKILLLVCADGGDRAGALAAIRIAQIMHAEVLLVYVVLVPRDLPITAPLPKEEETALNAFAEIEPLFAQDNIPTTRLVERGREMGTVLEDVMKERKAHTLIVALDPHDERLDHQLKIVRSILSKVRQAVMFIRPPLA